jgi:hypothetical protein
MCSIKSLPVPHDGRIPPHDRRIQSSLTITGAFTGIGGLRAFKQASIKVDGTFA